MTQSEIQKAFEDLAYLERIATTQKKLEWIEQKWFELEELQKELTD